MQIGAINSFNYNQNSISQRQKNTSFGHIILSENYKRALINNATEEDARAVYELTKKPINLKEMLHYDEAIPEKKKLLDEYLAQFTEEEINDLPVKFDSKTHVETWLQKGTWCINHDEALQTGAPCKYNYWDMISLNTQVKYSSSAASDCWSGNKEDDADPNGIARILKEVNSQMADGVKIKQGRKNNTFVPILNDKIFNNIEDEVNNDFYWTKVWDAPKSVQMKIEEADKKAERKRKMEAKAQKEIAAQQQKLAAQEREEREKQLTQGLTELFA